MAQKIGERYERHQNALKRALRPVYPARDELDIAFPHERANPHDLGHSALDAVPRRCHEKRPYHTGPQIFSANATISVSRSARKESTSSGRPMPHSTSTPSSSATVLRYCRKCTTSACDCPQLLRLRRCSLFGDVYFR